MNIGLISILAILVKLSLAQTVDNATSNTVGGSTPTLNASASATNGSTLGPIIIGSIGGSEVTSTAAPSTIAGAEVENGTWTTAAGFLPSGGLVCSQPVVKGDCKALIRRYYFDHTAAACREFFYGGCGGNENNFESKSDCQQKCLGNVGGGSLGSTDSIENATAVVKAGRCPSSAGPFPNITDGSSNSTTTINCTSTECEQDSECPAVQLCCNVDACGRALCMPPASDDSDSSDSGSRNLGVVANPPSTNPSCRLSLDAGPCRANFPRFGFDGTSCVEFVFGGCQGNANNFLDKANCETACGVPSKPKECPMIKIVPPPGCEIVTSTVDGCPKPEIKCTEGACAENPCPNVCDNCVNEPKQCFTTPCPQYRCDSKENCDNTWIIDQPFLPLFPFPPGLPTPTPLPSTSTGRIIDHGGLVSPCALVLCAPDTVCRDLNGLATCVPTPMAGAISQIRSGNGNGGSSRAQIVSCQLQPDVGPCRASMDRWFYNLAAARCDQFVFGGCAGNENNFESRQSCESACAAFVNSQNAEKPGECPRSDDRGGQVGICANECSTDSQCPSERKCCSNSCGGRTCTSPIPNTLGSTIGVDPGSIWIGGFGSTTMASELAVDSSTTTYSSFLGSTAAFDEASIGGQGANNIRYAQPRATGGPPDVDTVRRCRQDSETGPCKAQFPRWFYNSATGACDSFTYGGCAGNTNNFETREQCQQVCDGVPPCPVYSPPVLPPGCDLVTWTGTDGCPAIGAKCTGGECSRVQCPSKCEYCVNDPKQCVRAPCPQYSCNANSTCLQEQCSLIRCMAGTTCQVINNSVGCYPDQSSSTIPVQSTPLIKWG